jgi:hypothetical protein
VEGMMVRIVKSRSDRRAYKTHRHAMLKVK